MMTKLLLPKENLGQFVLTVDPNKSFYQQFKDLLKQHEIDIFQCYLRDTFNRRYSMSKPMKMSGFYPGISLELHYDQEDSDEKVDVSRFQAKPTKDDLVTINFFFTCNVKNDEEQAEVSVKTDRNSCIKNILLRDGLVSDENIDQTYVIYNHQVYESTQTFDGIGVLDEATLEIVTLNSDQIQQLQTINAKNSSFNNEDMKQQLQIDAGIDDGKMSQQEYLYFVRQKQQWAKEMGKDRILTPGERKQLLINRQTRKATLSFKVLSLQGRNLSKLRFSISAFGKLSDLYSALREKMEKVLQNVNLEQLYLSAEGAKGNSDNDNQSQNKENNTNVIQNLPAPSNNPFSNTKSQKLKDEVQVGTKTLETISLENICQNVALYTRTQNIEIPNEEFEAYEYFNGSDSIIVLHLETSGLDQHSIDALYSVLM